MKFDELDKMKGGWFIGNFVPSVHVTKDFEVAVKRYRAGDSEPMHEHRMATEITLIIEGTARMANRTMFAGQIVVLAPGEATSFVAITDCTTVCVKTPSIPSDKFVVPEPARIRE